MQLIGAQSLADVFFEFVLLFSLPFTCKMNNSPSINYRTAIHIPILY